MCATTVDGCWNASSISSSCCVARESSGAGSVAGTKSGFTGSLAQVSSGAARAGSGLLWGRGAWTHSSCCVAPVAERANEHPKRASWAWVAAAHRSAVSRRRSMACRRAVLICLPGRSLLHDGSPQLAASIEVLLFTRAPSGSSGLARRESFNLPSDIPAPMPEASLRCNGCEPPIEVASAKPSLCAANPQVCKGASDH